MQTLIQMTLLGAIVAFGASVYLFTAALHEARYKFPLAIQNGDEARHAFGTLIWSHAVGPATRRKYALAVACLTAAAGFAALALSIHGNLAGAVTFGFVFVAGAATSLMRWMKPGEND